MNSHPVEIAFTKDLIIHVYCKKMQISDVDVAALKFINMAQNLHADKTLDNVFAPIGGQDKTLADSMYSPRGIPGVEHMDEAFDKLKKNSSYRKEIFEKYKNEIYPIIMDHWQRN